MGSIPPLSLLRLLDANANRAREAYRTIEDAARFLLNDPAPCEDLKQARHALTHLSARLFPDHLARLDARDTEGDVGTSITTPSEFSRPSPRAVVQAAFARLTEALRSLEEFSKGAGKPAEAAEFETLRYRAYTLEKTLTPRFPTGRAPQWRLCVLLTRSLCRRPWEEVAREAIAGGADCLQLREKAPTGDPAAQDLFDRTLLDLTHRLLDLAAGRAAVVVNDRLDIALAAGAQGVHLGQTDLPIDAARRAAGDRLLIGVSTENLDQARAAASAGADLCGVGPMFATTTKAKPRLAGPEYLRAYLAHPRTAATPHLAIGGITPANVSTLAKAGCRGVAVSSVVCGAGDPRAVCEELRGKIEASGVEE